MNAVLRKPESHPHSFNELALSYVAQHAAAMSPVQLHRRLEHLGNHLLVFFGAFDLNEITPTKLQKFTYYLEAQGLRPKEVQACMVSFRLCVRHAIQQHWDINPDLLKPMALDDGFQPEPGQLSDTEYTNLYQNLLQDLTSKLFH